MQRLAFKMKLFDGYADEYKKRHAEIWPELNSLLREKGIEEYSIFLDEETNILFAYLVIQDAKYLDELAQNEIMQEWWNYMKDIMETREDNSPVTHTLKEVFCLE
jgi:L-rhamnose mutarotase